MGRGKSKRRAVLIAIMMLFLSAPLTSRSAVLYKRYSVHRVNGADILGEPYTVRKNDYATKLLKQKGVISQEDFPEFLDIFRKINPRICNINRIHPGDRIIIPLKKIGPGTFPGQESGIVKIPFITTTAISQLVKNHSSTYRLKRGDYISKLVSRRFGPFGTDAYKRGMKLFKMVNPHIPDLNKVRAGSEIILPDKDLASQPWYASLFDHAGTLSEPPIPTDKQIIPGKTRTNFGNDNPGSSDPLSQVAGILGTSLHNRGTCFLPRKRGDDFKLDLTRYPMMNFAGGQRVLFSKGEQLPHDKRRAVQTSWKNTRFAQVPEKATLGNVLDSLSMPSLGIFQKQPLRIKNHELEIEVRPTWLFTPCDQSKQPGRKTVGTPLCIFSVNSEEEMPPTSLVHYLGTQNIKIKTLLKGKTMRPDKDTLTRSSDVSPSVRLDTTNHRIFTKALIHALDLHYDPQVTISFLYAGIPITASSSMVSNGLGYAALLDFGDLKGDAAFAIEKSGLRVICIDTEKPLARILPRILNALNLTYETNPAFTWRSGSEESGISLRISGVLVVKSPEDKCLFTWAKIPDDLKQYLFSKGIKIIQPDTKRRQL